MLKAVTHRGVHVGLLVGLLLRLRLFLLMLSATPGRLSQGLLACAGHVSYMPITGLRALRGLAGWLGFLRMAALFFAAHVCGVRSTLFRRTPTGCTFLRCRGKRCQPRAFLDVSLHLLARGGYGLKAAPTSETRIVMCADNMVKISRIILDGIRTKCTA